jgi:hypothetical protein
VSGPTAGTTRTVTVPDANFTAARTDAAQSFTGDQTLSTGNLIQGTAAKGFNFTANTPASGMTSQLLNWYEEGTWTPTLVGGTTAGSYTVTATGAKYTRIGNQVTITGRLAITINTPGTGSARFGGLPFTKPSNTYLAGSIWTSNVTYGLGVLSLSPQTWTGGADSTFAVAGTKSGAAPYDLLITDILAGAVVYITMTYLI